jgi:hypothetical protein
VNYKQHKERRLRSLRISPKVGALVTTHSLQLKVRKEETKEKEEKEEKAQEPVR